MKRQDLRAENLKRFEFPKQLVALSVKANKIAGNKHGWPVCASLYASKLRGGMLATASVAVVDWLFFWDKGHCRKSWMMRRR